MRVVVCSKVGEPVALDQLTSGTRARCAQAAHNGSEIAFRARVGSGQFEAETDGERRFSGWGSVAVSAFEGCILDHGFEGRASEHLVLASRPAEGGTPQGWALERRVCASACGRKRDRKHFRGRQGECGAGCLAGVSAERGGLTAFSPEWIVTTLVA